VEVEEKLAMQKQSDAEAAKKREEEARLKAEQARLVAEQEERERLEKMAKLNAGRMEIEAAERELALKKQALRDALKVADEADVDEDEDDNEGSESTADQHAVRFPNFLTARIQTHHIPFH
jgi:trichohyalin